MAGPEAKFQSEILKFLKKHGAVALKFQQNATTPAGVSDIFFCKEGFYGFIEVKRAKNASLRPGQKEFVEKMNNWSYGKIVYPGECWEETKKELEEILR